MVTIIELPQVGESVTEGVIGRWLVEPGERVERYAPLVEVMTDKVNMEVPSPCAGVFVRALVEEGDTVPMGQPICEMETEGAAAQPAGAPAQPAGAPALEASGAAEAPDGDHGFEFMNDVRSVGPTGSGEGGQGRPDAVQDAAAGRSVEGEARRTVGPDRRRVVSPLVARLAAEHRIDLSTVAGTGVGGRVTKDDVLRAAGTARAGATPAAAPANRSDAGDVSTLPLTALRKTIAEHMARAAREIPAAWSMMEVDVSGLVRARAAHRGAFERESGVSLSYLPFFAAAASAALRDHPRLNARWDADRITLHDRVNLGIAVSTDGGLVVPVVHDADTSSVGALAVALDRLIAAARSSSLTIDQVQGGTFTLNNTGALGSVVSVPIINHPQAAILTTEAIVKRPVVVEGDAIAVRSMMNVCLTFDHRVCDGAEAGAFLQSVKTRLEAIDETMALDGHLRLAEAR